jgi:hypothetical protein
MLDLVSSAIGAVLLLGICAIAATCPDRRGNYVRAKYGDTFLGRRILNRGFWTGQSAAELRDSLGSPTDIEESILDNRPKEIWRYATHVHNRSELRFTLEKDVVLEWEWKTV